MKRPKLLKEEVLYYLKEEYESDLRKEGEEVWLTTRGLQKRLESRGILISWATLSLRLMNLLALGQIKKIKTSSGDCWKPLDEQYRI